MADVVFILTVVGFIAVCVLYVRGLDRLVRAAEEADSAGETHR